MQCQYNSRTEPKHTEKMHHFTGDRNLQSVKSQGDTFTGKESANFRNSSNHNENQCSERS